MLGCLLGRHLLLCLVENGACCQATFGVGGCLYLHPSGHPALFQEKERQRLESLRRKEEAEQLRRQKVEEDKRRRLEEMKL